MNTRRCRWKMAALICAAPFALWLGGCATASQPANMIAAPVRIEHQNPTSVLVSVSGGSETSAMTAPGISNEDFASAIRRSLLDSKLFAKVAESLPADYRLDVMIVRVQQPMFGASFSVTMESSWRLTHVSDNAVVWEKAITSSFSGKWNDAFAGVTRLRMATEGAARTNISDAISMMGHLSLK